VVVVVVVVVVAGDRSWALAANLAHVESVSVSVSVEPVVALFVTAAVWSAELLLNDVASTLVVWSMQLPDPVLYRYRVRLPVCG